MQPPRGWGKVSLQGLGQALWAWGLPKCVQVTTGGGVPLIMQSKRAVRPSTTSTSSSLRVKSGCTEGCTVSRALQVSSSARRGGRNGPHAACLCAGQEAACVPHPPTDPAANVVVAERTPRLVGDEPGCAGCQALSLRGAGGVQMCARSLCPGLVLCWQQGASFLPS